jgi:outer membrane protein TolC
VRTSNTCRTREFIVSYVRWASSAALAILVLPQAALATPLTLEEAIHSAWKNNAGIAASAAATSASQADVESAGDARLPSLVLSARAIATTEPVAAFGMKLDEQRIGAADFDPSRLNSPNLTGGIGLGATLMQPLYMGGRLTAGKRAAENQAAAEEQSHERRRQELAFGVVQAYFGVQVATERLGYAKDVLAQARATEDFSKARNQQGMVLDADVARATAFRAQAEADEATARQQLASALATLALLTGDAVVGAELTTPLTTQAASASPSASAPETRADLQSSRLHAEAAREMAKVAKGSLLPEVFAQASVETLRSELSQGATWYTVGVMARWKLSLADLPASRAAERRAHAADEAFHWQAQQARHDVEEARRMLDASRSKLVSAEEAVAASQSARSLRLERHRQGLLPLTDVLDAEAGLAGARTLFLRSQFEARVAAAQLQLALGEPIEGVR